MEFNQIGQLFESSERDACAAVEGVVKRDDTADLGDLFKEINQVYSERLVKLDEAGDSSEVKMKLLYMWVTDLLEQNASLVETFGELEKVAAERVVLLEDKLRKSATTVQEYMAKIQDPDTHSLMSLQALVTRLEVDISSLLELIRRARTEGTWNMRGLVFHEVSYCDIFGCLPPPPSAPKKETHRRPTKEDLELLKLKTEVDFWRTRAEKAESEALSQQFAVGELGQQGSCAAADRNQMLQQELDQARRLVIERAEQIRVLNLKLDEADQHSKDVQAVLTAEVAEKHDQVVQLRQRVQQLEEDCRQANMQTHFRDEIIKGMRKEVKRFKSQLAVMDHSSCELSDIMHGPPNSSSPVKADSGPVDAYAQAAEHTDNTDNCVGVERDLKNVVVPDQLSVDSKPWLA